LIAAPVHGAQSSVDRRDEYSPSDHKETCPILRPWVLIWRPYNMATLSQPSNSKPRPAFAQISLAIMPSKCLGLAAHSLFAGKVRREDQSTGQQREHPQEEGRVPRGQHRAACAQGGRRRTHAPAGPRRARSMYCQPQMTRKDRSSAARSRTTPISAGKGKVKVVAQSRHEAGRARRRQARRPADVRDAEDVRGAVGRRSGKKESERVTTGVSLLDDLGAGVRDRKRAWTTCRGQAGDLHLLSSSTR
jgi:hypothetical protein